MGKKPVSGARTPTLHLILRDPCRVVFGRFARAPLADVARSVHHFTGSLSLLCACVHNDAAAAAAWVHVPARVCAVVRTSHT